MAGASFCLKSPSAPYRIGLNTWTSPACVAERTSRLVRRRLLWSAGYFWLAGMEAGRMTSSGSSSFTAGGEVLSQMELGMAQTVQTEVERMGFALIAVEA